MDFRAVRLKIAENSYECIITNPDRNTFPPEKIKALYHMRWGIETSFRDLKHTMLRHSSLSKIRLRIASSLRNVKQIVAFAKLTAPRFGAFNVDTF